MFSCFNTAQIFTDEVDQLHTNRLISLKENGCAVTTGKSQRCVAWQTFTTRSKNSLRLRAMYVWGQNARSHPYKRLVNNILTGFFFLKINFRVQKELKQLQSLKPHGIEVTLPSDSLQIWEAVVPGSEESLYKGDRCFDSRYLHRQFFDNFCVCFVSLGGRFKVQVYLPYPSDKIAF